MSTDVEFLRVVATRLREGKSFESRDGGDYSLSTLEHACNRLEQMARHIERVPAEPVLVRLGRGLVLKTKESQCFEDLPWDAYVESKDGKIREWSDGYSEIEAIKKVLKKASEKGHLKLLKAKAKA